MQLDSHISDLLYRYECVILPGFGAFLTRTLPARFDEEKNIFEPPTKLISFNSQLQTNDGLLANHVASTEGLPYEVALLKVRNYASLLSEKVLGEETVTIDKVGSFQLNEDGKIQFTSLFYNFNTSSFGLAPVKALEVKREIYAGQAEELEKKAPVLISLEKRKSRPYLRYASIAAIALMATGFAGYKYYENEVIHQNMTAQQEAAVQLESQIQEATFIIENPLPALNLNVRKEVGSFHIVAGAFRLEENADNKVSQLKETGYHPRKIATRHGLFQVTYGSYVSKAEAMKFLHQIQQSENPHAWLLVQEIE